jgi:hypothetical protein
VFVSCIAGAATEATQLPHNRKLLSLQANPQQAAVNSQVATDGASGTPAANNKAAQVLGATVSGGASSRTRLTRTQADHQAATAAAAAAAQRTFIPTSAGDHVVNHVNSKVVGSMGATWGPSPRPNSRIVKRRSAQATPAIAVPKAAKTVPWQTPTQPANH